MMFSFPIRLRRRAAGQAVRHRRGAALIEIMIAMTIMVIALTGVAAMTLHAGRRSTALASSGGRTAVQTQVVDQLMVVPYNVLPSKVGCTTVTALPYPHRRCVTVANLSIRRRRVTVAFTPASRLLRADTLVFERTQGVSNSPLN